MSLLRYARTASGLIWASVFVVLVFVARDPVRMVTASWWPGRILQAAMPLLGAVLLVSFILPRPEGTGRVRGLGLGPGRRHAIYLVSGLAMGFGVAATVVIVQYWMGAVQFESGAVDLAWALDGSAATVALSLVVFMAASAGEELLFRGYGFQQLGRAVTPVGACCLTALLFGAMHARNPEVSSIAILNTAEFGLLFGIALVRHRSLWLPYGIHVGWNFTLGILGAEISGLKISILGLSTVPSGPTWLSGGGYGPEASMVTTASVALMLWLLWSTPVIAGDDRLMWDDNAGEEPEGGRV